MLNKVAATATILLFSMLAHAWPTKPISILVPYAPGGINDQIARHLAPDLSTSLGVPVTIVNAPGGNHVVALNQALGNRDDHTFLMVDAAMASGTWQKDQNLVNQFQVFAILGTTPLMLSSSNKISLEQFRSALQNRDQLPVASGGADTPHMMWLTSLQSPVSYTAVYYRGAGPAMSDLIAGHVPYGIASMNLTEQFTRQGQINPIMISTTQRHPNWPNVPTYLELGFRGPPGFMWYGMAVLRNMSAERVNKFAQAVATSIRTNSNLKQMEASGLTFAPRLGQDAQNYFVKDANRYSTKQ